MKTNIQKTINYYKYGPEESLQTLPTYSSWDECISGKNGISFMGGHFWNSVAQNNYANIVPNRPLYEEIISFENLFKMNTLVFQSYTIANQLPWAILKQIKAYDEENKYWDVIFDGRIYYGPTTLNVTNSPYSHRYKFVFESSESGIYAYCGMYYFNLAGMIKPVQVGTPQNYDFYKESYNTHPLKKEQDNYYCLKSFEKGQYYGN